MISDATSAALEDLQAWVGRSETTTDVVTPQLAQRLSATIEATRDGTFERGSELPQMWYSVLFPRVVPRSQLGRDGHPALGDFLPPVPLPKRMFAGKRIQFVAPIRIGDELERISTIASIAPKQGSSGPLVFVTVRHTIRNAAGTVVVEEQDVVYRSSALGKDSASAKAAAAPAFEAQHRSDPIVADSVMIFRYSALCFNGHRIHYDLPYATQVEGYPALVVNGGLSALCAVEHLHQAWGGTRLSQVTTRNTAPLFEGDPFRVESRGGQDPDEILFRVVTEAGKTTLQGSARRAHQ
ncbi:MAG: MaoC family dehydratase N-terminal domain-containing protein [Pigmentiphaga sp.]|uniref:FAS1-like dehydratase domain-containing protein n=1 Tax=Pigmentiphaga sp. TaxID=1977564 RepID=UPI0029A8F60C|nr:MaoC family dehydratase N-terminal domain-containing protein [Pigmentiphaga sp.]MDX3904483.1 MaoC family dehydratase N-terminal domain-containing protein [Pigmentiphaga sp.]